MNNKPAYNNNHDDDIVKMNKSLYKLKVSHVILTSFLISIILYVLYYLGSLVSANSFFLFFHKSFFHAFADACLIASIVGITFEIIVKKETETNTKLMIREVVAEQTINIIDRIPQTLLLNQTVQRKILSNAKLNEIILNALEIQSNDRKLAEGVYNSIIKNAISPDDRWYNYRYEIFIEDIVSPAIPEAIRNEFFDVIMRLTYDTKLKKTKFLFTCASTINQFNNLINNPDYEVRHLMPVSDYFNTADESSFQVLEFTVDDISLSITPYHKPDGSFEIACENPSLADRIGKNVTISYTYKIKAERVGHAIFTSVIYPTHDVLIEFNYAKASIDYVEVLDYFVSSEKPAIKYIPNPENSYKISVQLKDWAFPKGGAAFVWILKDEQNLVKERRGKIQSAKDGDVS